jgi:putative oxidoreductase
LLPIALAAGSATAFEMLMPPLLVLGLFARPAALPLIAMTMVIQFTYLDHVDHLYWILLLGLILTFGP